MPVKEVSIPIRDISDGLNTTDPATDVGRRYVAGNGRKQVIACRDIMLHSKKQRPGSAGVSGVFTTYCRGLHSYLQQDGTDRLLSVSDGKLYSHVKASPFTKTQLFNMGGSGESCFADHYDICVVANGTEVVKVDGASAYRLGIAAPVGATSGKAAGGTLADGVYNIILSHTRKVGGAAVLHSTGLALTAQTLGSGDNTISVAFSDASSSDAQITHVTVWMTDAGGTVYYYYGEAAIDAGTVSITSDTNKNTALLYSVQAQRNYAVPNFTYVWTHNGYLYGSVGSRVYRSLRAGTKYDLERFDTRAVGGNTADFPYTIEGGWSLNGHVYLNTPAGIIKLPDGELNAQFEMIEGEYFKYPRTVVQYKGGLLGVTGKRVGFFDGERVLPYDIAQDIKPTIQALFNGYDDNFRPCAALYRRNDRTEYHLCYRDTSVGVLHNNRRLVLNLDTLRFVEENQVRAAWEVWSNGSGYMTVDSAGDMYEVQSLASDGVVFTKNIAKNTDANLYHKDKKKSDHNYGFSLSVGRIVLTTSGVVRWYAFRLLALYSSTITVLVDASSWPDKNLGTYEIETTGGVSRYSIARYGVSRYMPESAIFSKSKLSRTLKSPAVTVTISGVLDDPVFEFNDSSVLGTLTESRYT